MITWLICEAIMASHVKGVLHWINLRHNYINDLIYHILLQAGLPSIKEPAGLLCTDGKRPDNLTNVPWQAGTSAVWDVTVADILTDSYLVSTLMIAAAALLLLKLDIAPVNYSSLVLNSM